MRTVYILSFLFVFTISQCFANDLIIGTTYNNRLAWQQKAEYMAIPFKKRVKEVFYSDPSQQIIKGIVARDIERTGASATITAGGVGATYANIRLKSERGGGLNYQIEYYV